MNTNLNKSVGTVHSVSQTPTASVPSLHRGTSSTGSSIHDEKFSTSKLEKGEVVAVTEAWDGYLDDPLPEKKDSKIVRNLRSIFFSVYRRIFTISFIANMSIFIWACSRYRNGGEHELNAKWLGQVVIGNLFAAIVIRQDHVINFLFLVFCAVPPSWPLFIRRVAAKIYSIGGIHSSAGVSGTLWLILLCAQGTREVIGVTEGKTSVATLTVSYLILALLLTMIGFAHPTVRRILHNRFEHTHRFMGWTAVGLVWAQVILLAKDYKPDDWSLGHAVAKAPPFWLTIILTLSIAGPWTHLRKIKVNTEVLSNHCVRIHFDGTLPFYGAPVPGSFARISTDPLFEWHSFATLYDPKVSDKAYSLVVSRAGDWTSKIIANPPTEIWIRGIPTTGVMRICPLFRRLVVVATGSGIGPVAPHVLACKVPIQLLWTAPNVRQTFGDKLVDRVLEASPNAVIYDTRKHGKPDMVKLTYRLVKQFNAEAVCIISNKPLTDKVVYGMVSRGIPAFGAIWDS